MSSLLEYQKWKIPNPFLFLCKSMPVGIPEMETNDAARSLTENTKEVVFKFLAEQLKINRPGDKIEFQRVHRLGKSNSSKPRPIIARFLRFAYKQLVINDYSNGGLRMSDIQSFNQALKAKWIQKYLDQKKQRQMKIVFELFFSGAQCRTNLYR